MFRCRDVADQTCPFLVVGMVAPELDGRFEAAFEAGRGLVKLGLDANQGFVDIVKFALRDADRPQKGQTVVGKELFRFTLQAQERRKIVGVANLDRAQGSKRFGGNLNESIELWRYVTERSFDAYSWQLLNTKANFIEQVMTAGSGLRTIEDISMSAMTYAEIKAIASGNPLVMEKAGIDADVQKYSLLRGQWEEQQWRASSSERAIKSRLARIDKLIPAIEEDAKLAMAVNEKTVFAPATSNAQKAVDAAGSGMTGLAAAFRAHSNMGGSIAGGSIEIGKIGGFAVEYAKIACQAVMYVVGPNSQEEIRVDRPHMNDLGGMAKAVMETVKSFTTASADLRAEYGRKTNELASAKQLLAQEFEYADRLAALLERQREINAELDLDKDAAGTQTMAAEAG